MSVFIPKNITEDAWVPFRPHLYYAVKSDDSDNIVFCFGQGHGIYLSIIAAGEDRLIHTIDMDNGELTLVGKITQSIPSVLGRTSESTIKIMHAIVSRQHLKFILLGSILLVKDLGSTNGSSIYRENKFFEVERYLDDHPIDKAHEQTLDSIHETFGPTLDDFLKKYLEKKDEYK
ncbi:MAG: FHA domain-containing protein [Elusimicrobiota bacterium]